MLCSSLCHHYGDHHHMAMGLLIGTWSWTGSHHVTQQCCQIGWDSSTLTPALLVSHMTKTTPHSELWHEGVQGAWSKAPCILKFKSHQGLDAHRPLQVSTSTETSFLWEPLSKAFNTMLRPRKEVLWRVGMTTREASPHCRVPLQLPPTYINQPQVLSLAKVIAANIRLNRVTKQLKGVNLWCSFPWAEWSWDLTDVV